MPFQRQAQAELREIVWAELGETQESTEVMVPGAAFAACAIDGVLSFFLPPLPSLPLLLCLFSFPFLPLREERC